MASNGRFPRFPQPFQITAGPFLGINDTPALSAQDGQRASAMQNCYVPVPGGDVLSRPGTTRNAVPRTLTGVVVWGAQASGYALTGTITATNGSTAVTGVGTAFTTQLVPGAAIYNATLGGAGAIVLSIASDTALTLAGAWGGTTGTRSDWKGGANGAQTLVLATALSDTIQVGDVVDLNGTGALVTNRTSGTSWTVAGAPAANYQATTTAYGGGVVTGPMLAMTQHTRTDGTTYRLAFAVTTNTEIAGGATSKYRFLDGTTRIRLIRWDPSAAVLNWTDTTSSSMDAIDLDIDKRIYLKTFANYLLISDGTNRIRKVDFSSLPATLTNLTDYASAALGRPTVYYGKLFMIKTDGVTITWSEENDPDTGYEASGYNNAWQLNQTSPDALEAIEGTNNALYCFRQNSITAITGAVTTTFASSGTQDGISTTVGTRSPDAVCVVGDSVFFLDSQCRPHVIDPGRGVIPLYSRIVQTLGTSLPTSASQLRKAWGQVVTSMIGNPLIVWCFPLTESATTQSQMLVFDAYTRECLGTWILPSTVDHTYSAIFKDANGLPRLALNSATTTDIAMYYQRAENDASVYLDTLNTGSTAGVDAYVVTPKLGGDPQIEKLFTRMDVTSGDVSGNEPTLTAAYQSSTSSAYTAEKAMDHVSVASGFPSKFTRMTDLRGRWAQYRVRNDTSTAGRVTVGQVVVEGIAYNDSPKGIA